MALPSVLFVRGCARSGTTLLADVLNEHPSIGLLVEQPLGDVVRRMHELFWYETFLERERAAIERASARAGSDSGGKTAHFTPRDNASRLRFPRRYPSRDRLAQIVTAVVEASLEKDSLRIVGSKTPGHWRYDE